MSLKSSFVSFLHLKYPSLEASLLDSVISDRLLSPFQVTLSAGQVNSIKTEIKNYWQLRNWGAHHLNENFLSYGLRKSENYSACMSYDFHINAAGKPELIEINTNASFLALGLELYEFLNLPQSFSEQALVKMFKDEGATDSIAIIDEKPSSQRLFVEFLIYQKLFEKNGLRAEIFDIDEVERLKEFSLTYNRYTDFYLRSEAAEPLRQAFNAGLVQLSPTPYEYFLLADKQRLLDWNRQSEIAKPESLLKIYDLAIEDRDAMWNERKQLFFKPKNSFGGKQTYKGASMSRRIFDDVFKPEFVAQQLSVPPELEFTLDNEPVKFKYDLRCFAYKDQLQLMIARLYQGQTTNLQTPGGGFAAVKIN